MEFTLEATCRMCDTLSQGQTMKRTFMQQRGLRVGFSRGTDKPSACRVYRPDATGQLHVVPPEVLERERSDEAEQRAVSALQAHNESAAARLQQSIEPRLQEAQLSGSAFAELTKPKVEV